jgi:hypothetical protein
MPTMTKSGKDCTDNRGNQNQGRLEVGAIEAVVHNKDDK